MNRSLLAGVAIALCFGTLPAPNRAQAGPTLVQQCRTSDGSAVYTDKPCRAIGGQSMPIRAELATRIVREQAFEARVSGVEVQTIPTTLQTMGAAQDAIGRRSVAGGCAHTPTQLAMDLRGAFALGDVNRIAESYHWVGMSQRAANATMQHLEQLAKRSVIDTHYYDAQISGDAWIASADGTADVGGSAGVLQVQFGEGAVGSVQDFDVERYAGCYFVRF
jgi:hypothetical protein